MTSPSPNPKPLCVDLDGTLIQTDCLFETLLGSIHQNPATLFKVPQWLAQGRPTLKAKLAEQFTPEIPHLPWNQAVIDFVKEEKHKGRKILLVTASHIRIAEAIAQHLGLFDEVLATDGNVNLKSHKKAQILVEKFGEGNFDYIGNESCDLPIWKAAGSALIANSTSALEQKAQNQNLPVNTIGDPHSNLFKAAVKACRPHQWAKNVLLFVPILTAHLYVHPQLLINTVLAFLSMGLCASTVYILNDLMDLESDRKHHSKRRRPIPSGKLPVHVALFLPPILLITSFCIAWFVLNPTFTALLTLYLFITSAYSLYLKQKILIDVFLLAGLYSMRIIIGASVACEQNAPLFTGFIELSNWLITFSTLFFLSLAMAKRYSELHNLAQTNRERPAGRSYHINDRPLISQLGVTSGFLAVLVFALYIHSDKSTALYHTPEALWLICPSILYWITYVWLVTTRGKMREDPVTFAIKDKISYLVGIAIVIAPLLANPK